jgi:hypothetical protein
MLPAPSGAALAFGTFSLLGVGECPNLIHLNALSFHGAYMLIMKSAAESRSVLGERALVCGRHIFGWYFPFRVAQLNARARGGKLKRLIRLRLDALDKVIGHSRIQTSATGQQPSRWSRI